MSESAIGSIMDVTMEKIRQMVDVNTVVGEAINTPDGTVIIPVSKVAYGFGSGGSDFPSTSKGEDSKAMFGGGAGAGITITPLGFLTVSKGQAKMIQVQSFENSVDRIIELAPELIQKITDMINNKKNKKDKCVDKETL